MADYAVSTKFTAVDGVSAKTKIMSSAIQKYGSEAERAFDKASRAADRAARAQAHLQKMGGGLKAGAVAGGALIAAGTVAALNKTSAALESVISTGDRLNDTANAIGLTTKALQEYEYVAALSGIETEAMDKALTKLTVGLGKGDTAVTEALGAIGVSFESVKNANPDQVLEAVAEGFKNTSDPTLKAAAATALFGKSNVKMVNALSGGAESLRELRLEAHKTGYVMSDELIRASAENDDQMNRLKANFRGVANTLGSNLIPILTKGANSVIEFMQANRDSISSGIDKFFQRLSAIGQKLMPLFRKLAPVFDQIGEIFDAIIPIIGQVVEIVGELIPILNPVIDLVKRLAVTVGRLLADAFKFLKPIIATITNIFVGIGPIIGRIVDKFAGFIAVLLKSLGPALEKILPIIERVLITVFKIAEPIISTMIDLFSGFVSIIGAVANAILTVLKPVLDFIMPILEEIGRVLGAIVGGIGDALKFVGIIPTDKNIPIAQPGSAASAMNQIFSSVKAPNSDEAAARQRNIEFNGQLNISGAPAGSTMQSQTTGAPPVKTNLMGAPAR